MSIQQQTVTFTAIQSALAKHFKEMSEHWQHENPLHCPKRHLMIWLGSAFWICEKCHVIYVQTAPRVAKVPA